MNTVFDFRAERRDGDRRLAPRRPGTAAPGSRSQARARRRPTAPATSSSWTATRLSASRASATCAAALHSSSRAASGPSSITRGGDGVLAWAGEGRFSPIRPARAPREREGNLESGALGQSRGRHDRLRRRLRGRHHRGPRPADEGRQGRRRPKLDLADALSWGIAAGAFTLGILGGTYYESRPGREARSRILLPR